jgi:sigma-B regulation protein RsbU (phosphoserine phosphatase)
MPSRPTPSDLMPAAVIAVVAAADVWLGSGQVVLGLVVIAPLLAANLCTVRVTVLYAVGAFVVALVLGVYNDQYTPETIAAQLIRLGGVLSGGVMGVAAARYRRLREERLAQVIRVAEVVQRAVLPPVPPRIERVDLAVHYESAAAEASVGGDFYAAVTTPAGVRLLVGDVRGKGLDAVRLAAGVLAAFRERATEREALDDVLADLDRAVRREAGDEDFVTALLCQIEPDGGLTVTSAGHPMPFVVRDRTARLLVPRDVRPPLGLDGTGRAQRFELGFDERLLLYTDGLVEAHRDIVDGLDRLPRVARALRMRDVTVLAEQTAATMLRGAVRRDDTLVVAARRC